jgi:hypothetical protein
MSEPVNIDFSQLKSPDYVGSYVNAFQAGQALAQRTAAGANALTSPAGAGPDPMSTLRSRIAAMNDAERARAGEQADLLAGVGQGLQSVPYTERAAVLAHLAPALAARGVPAAAMTAFDSTDEALGATVTSARSIGAMLGAG